MGGAWLEHATSCLYVMGRRLRSAP